MSELRTHSLRHNSATGDANIEMYADGSTSIRNLQNFAKSLVINGAMTVAQRSTEETSVTTGAYRTCDRFRISMNSLGAWTVQQSTESPDGFANSLRLLCTTADATPAANDNLMISHRIEALNCQQLFNTGTTTHPMTLSFWVRSSRTGDASIDLRQPDNSNRSFSTSYNIAAANTWEHKVVPIPADTAAVFDNNSGEGLRIDWWLNSGSNFTGGAHQAGWGAVVDTNRNATNLGIGTAVDDDFHLTGVQLTVTDADIGFQHESYGETLAKCQRYFQRVFVQGIVGNYNSSSNFAFFNVSCHPMRTAAPDSDSTNIQVSEGRLQSSGGTSVAISSFGFFNRQSGRIAIARSSGDNTFNAVTCCTSDLNLNAEL